MAQHTGPPMGFLSFLFLKRFLYYLFLERGKGREKVRERNIDVRNIDWLLLTCP